MTDESTINKIKGMIKELSEDHPKSIQFNDEKTVILKRPDQNIIKCYPWEYEIDKSKNQTVDLVLYIGWMTICLGCVLGVLAFL